MDYSKVFPVEEYYRKFVVPINPRLYRISSSGKMVCPVHNDHDPSLGIVQSKSDGELVHCFGCNFWGNVVDLHRRVCKRHFKRYLSEEDAKKELCNIFNMPYSLLPKEKTKSVDKGIKEEIGMLEAEDKFDISDYRELVLKGKLSKKPVAYFNMLLVNMISEVKNERI